jgi:hypothetical protein
MTKPTRELSLFKQMTHRSASDHALLKKIVTSHNFPPIPTRCFDWSAHWESFEEGPYGYGATEAEAIADLTDNYDDPTGASDASVG